MSTQMHYPPRGVVGRHEENFQDVLYVQIRKTPWWFISCAVHGVIILVLWNATFTPTLVEDDVSIVANRRLDIDELLDDKVPEVEPIPLPPEPEDVPEVTHEDTDIMEPDPEDDEEWKETLADGPSEGPFEGPGDNGQIGIGGNAGGGGGHFGKRRQLRAEVSVETEGAVQDGLEWLKNHQNEDGYWDCDGFEAECRLNKCGGAGGALHDPGVTGLALLAFLGAGETNRTGRYALTVRRGLRYLKQIQDPEGCFGPRTTNHFTYSHAIATLAMAEAYGLTGSPLFKQSAQRGVDFIIKCQNPYLAWRYGVRPQDNDTSVTGWMVMALKSAKMAGLLVPEEGFAGARAWLDKVTEPEYGKVGYTARGTGPARPQDIMDKFPADRSEAMTAVGVLSRIFLGEDPRKSEMIRKGVELCVKVLPEWNEADGSIDMYYWYYGSLALFMVGGEPWVAWNAAMKTAIIDHQRKDGDQKGSWDPVGPWGREGGRVYSTAVCTLCLEVYYRYSRAIIGHGRGR